MSRLTRDGTTEPASRDQVLRREQGQGIFIFNNILVRYGVKYRKQSTKKNNHQAKEIFPEILARFSLANAQTIALTDEITKMSSLTLFVTSMKNYQSLEICWKIDSGLKSFQVGIDSVRPRSPHCCISP